MRSCWNLKLSNLIHLVFQLAFVNGLLAQFSLPQEILTGKSIGLAPYLFPVNPGQTNFLAGTMGELRSTHFHAGIDVRTGNMIGVPVFATQQGYISRIIVGAYGYGNAVMITHPDGNTSLYGHLDKFKGAIATHILKEHYAKKSHNLDLTFDLDQFPVNRGDTIGLSGNTGGSSGPHLHFEIRNANNEALNPLAFGFTEVTDMYSPIALKVALTTLDNSSRINDRFGRFEFSLLRSGNTYSLKSPILATGKIGVEILAHDKIDLSQFRCGINSIEMSVDNTKIFTQVIDKFNFIESYDIVTLMDYKTLKTQGNRFNKLYIADGNPLKFYQNVVSNGIIHVNEGNKKISIKLRDFSGNESNITFALRANPLTQKALFLEPMTKAIDYDQFENTLVVSSKNCGKTPSAKVFIAGKEETISPDYSNANRQVYLIDLRKKLPDSITTCSGAIQFNFKDAVPSGTHYDYYSHLVDIKFQNGNLYDTLYLNVAYEKLRNQQEKFTIGNLTTPLHQTISVTLKPQSVYKTPNKTFAYHLEGKRYKYVGGNWSNSRIQFNTHELGQFTLLTDSIPPGISRIYCNNQTARFRISDNLSGIASYEATIDGEWLLMKYDYKTGIVQSERFEKTKLLKGDFQLKVIDRAGNEKIYNQKIL